VHILVSFQSVRIEHLYNLDGIEVDKEGNPKKRGVNIARIFSLAKDVIYRYSLFNFFK